MGSLIIKEAAASELPDVPAGKSLLFFDSEDSGTLKFKRSNDAIEGATGLPEAEDWHYVGGGGEPAFQNDAANYSSEAVDLAPLRYRKDQLGEVHLEGVISTESSAVAFTFPAGCLPDRLTYRVGFDGATNQTVPVIVFPGGDVNVYAAAQPLTLDLRFQAA